MKYCIPLNKLDKLSKIMKHYLKKSSNIIFKLGNEVVVDGTLYINDSRCHRQITEPIKIRCMEVEVDGVYIINGWRFLGTIQFTDNGNIIRLADSSFEGKIPSKYLHTSQICEHCGTIRNRKDTYLIYNETTKEFKQIGSKCLLDYTKGIDANECASIMSCLDKFVEISNYDFSESDFYGNGYTAMNCGIDSKSLKRYAIALVKRYGYTKMQDGCGTASDLADFYFRNSESSIWEDRYGSLELASEDEVNAIDDFAKQYTESENQYMRNASLAWLNSYVEYRDFGLISSFANSYLKEMSKLSSRTASNYVGNIGDKIKISIASFRVLYISSYKVAYHTYAYSYTYEIIDTDSNIYILKTSKQLNFLHIDSDFVDIMPTIIEAKVKAHSEYKGIKQTQIERFKILEYSCC